MGMKLDENCTNQNEGMVRPGESNKTGYQLEKFYKGLDQLGITCSETQMRKFLAFYEMLVEKNKVMNLTSITEWELSLIHI